MYTSQLLQKAKNLIISPDLWLQGMLSNKPAFQDNIQPDTCRYCTIGAFQEIVDQYSPNDLMWNLYHTNAGVALTEAAIHLGHTIVSEEGLAAYNDLATTTHADIMVLYDTAIELQRKQLK